MSVPAKKELGQHFLVDENILGVIGRLAELAADDVVLEIGPGLGVLTRYLAERVARVHAVELDASLEPHLRDAGANVTLHLGDALRLDLSALAPDATKLVANLPYNIATPLVVESLDGLPHVRLWCVMVQREVADRLFAVPGTKAYGAVSVLVQLVVRAHRLPSGVAHGLPAAAERRLGARRLPPRRRSRPTSPTSSASSTPRSHTGGRRCRTRSSSPASRHAPKASPRSPRSGASPSTRAEALAPPEFLALAEALG